MSSGILMDPVAVLAVRLSLAVIFAGAALHKIRDLPGFHDAVRDYRLVPPVLVKTTGMLLLVAELLTAVLLVLPPAGEVGLALGVILLLLYAFAITVNLARGRTSIDCGCAGFDSGQPISIGLVVRNLFLAAAGLIALVFAGTRAILLADLATAGCTAVAFVMLYAAINQLLANAPAIARLRISHE